MVREEIENVANLQSINNLKFLKTASNHYRIRVGDYRIGISMGLKLFLKSS